MSSPMVTDTPVVELGSYFEEHHRAQTIYLGLIWVLQTLVPIIVKLFWIDDPILKKTATVLGIKVTTDNPEYNKWTKYAWDIYTWFHAGAHGWLIISWLISYIEKKAAQQFYYWSIEILAPISWVLQAVVTAFFIAGAVYNEAASVWKHIAMASVVDVIYVLYHVLAWFLKPRNQEFYDWDRIPW